VSCESVLKALCKAELLDTDWATSLWFHRRKPPGCRSRLEVGVWDIKDDLVWGLCLGATHTRCWWSQVPPVLVEVELSDTSTKAVKRGPHWSCEGHSKRPGLVLTSVTTSRCLVVFSSPHLVLNLLYPACCWRNRVVPAQ